MITFGDGAHDAMISMLQEAAAGRWIVQPTKADGEAGRDIQLCAVSADGMHGQLTDGPDGDPVGDIVTFGWIEYPHVHIY